MIRAIIAWGNVSATSLRTGIRTAHRVGWSIIERKYLHLIRAVDVDTDLYPTISTDMR